MAKIKDRAKPTIPPVEPGTYTAICVQAIELGEQLSVYKDTKKYTNQVMYVFELAGEFIEIDGEKQPRTLGRTFNLPANPKKSEKSGLRKFVEGWQGKKFSNEEFAEFDTNDVVGKECLLGVVLNDTGEYANIDSAMGLPKGMSAGKPLSELIRFDIEPWNQGAFDKLPEWAQEKIKKSTQYQKDHAPETVIEVKQAAEATETEDCPI